MKRRVCLEELDDAYARWEARLFRAMKALQKIRQQRKRVLSQPPPRTTGTSAMIRNSQPIADMPPEPPDDLSIPVQFLRKPNPKDEAAKAEILSQQEADKKVKTAARIAKLKADKAGERKKMPLQGKAALAAIKGM